MKKNKNKNKIMILIIILIILYFIFNICIYKYYNGDYILNVIYDHILIFITGDNRYNTNTLWNNKNIWIKQQSCQVEYIHISKKKDLIYKKYSDIYIINDIKNIYDNIKKFDFVPKIYYIDYKNFIIVEEYCNKLNKNNIPDDFIKQINNIEKILKNNNIYHNDIYIHHFLLKNKIIKLIDWDRFTINKPINDEFSSNNFKKIKIYLKNLRD